jgi:HEAT repeat protein
MRWWRLRRLRKQLSSTDYSAFDTRRSAAIELGQCKDAGSVPLLIRSIEPFMGQWLPEAAWALGQIGDVRAVEALIPLLVTGKKGMQEAAASALAEIGDARAIRPLVHVLPLLPHAATQALLNFGNAAVPALVDELSMDELIRRRAAVSMLQKLGWRPEKNTEQLAYAIAAEEWEVAAGLGAIAVEPLHEESHRLYGVDGQIDESRMKAVNDALAKIRDPGAVEPLLKVARHCSSGPVADALYASLVVIGDTAVEPLITLLTDGVPNLRSFAANVLAELRASRAVPPLLALLTDEFFSVRWAAASALDNLGWCPEDDRQHALHAIALQKWENTVAIGSAALGPLREAISFTRAPMDLKVAYSAMTAAMQIGGPKAVDVLVDTLRHRDGQVRSQAANMLASLHWEPPDDYQRAWLAVATGDFSQTAQCGLVGLEPLIAMLHDPDWNVRERAVTAVASLGGDKAIAELEWVAKNDPYSHFAWVGQSYESEASFPVREAAATALKQIKAKQLGQVP